MSNNKESLLHISSAPHIRSNSTIPSIMWTVVLALMPAAAMSVCVFGFHAFLVMASSIIAAVVAEAVMQVSLKRPVTVQDGSAVITGLLVAMNVPPGAPVWMVVIGSVFAIVIVKQLFGGLGFNIFNPALAARSFLMASWPVQMTTTWHRFSEKNLLVSDINNRVGLPSEVFDAITQATPLTVLKEGPKILSKYNLGIENFQDLIFTPEMLKSLFVGNVGGCIGETSAFFLLLGGLFLMYRRIITWHIPVSFIGTMFGLTYLYTSFTTCCPPHVASLLHILAGGVFLGAFFMATDMVTSPVSPMGMIIFGAGCGLITFVIRFWGGYPEGVSYSILLMNAFVPLIDRFIKPRVFGTKNAATESR